MRKGDITRTVIAEADASLPHCGVYVIAYMGRVLYVGKAELGVYERLRGHVVGAKSIIGGWLRRVDDWGNVRLDVIEPPYGEDGRAWVAQAEEALIGALNPLFNVALNVE